MMKMTTRSFLPNWNKMSYIKICIKYFKELQLVLVYYPNNYYVENTDVKRQSI